MTLINVQLDDLKRGIECADQSEKSAIVHEMKGMKYMKNVWQSRSENE